MKTPFIVIFVVGALLTAGAFAFGSDDSGPKRPKISPVSVIISRVEAIRGLKFKKAPKVERISAKEATKDGLADLDKDYPPARRHADEEVLKLLGLIAPKDDLRNVQASVFGEQVAGFYDPRRKRLAIVDGATGGGPALDEITIAHEFTHALEDANFKLISHASQGNGDRAQAETSLIEGSATALMFEYADRDLDPSEVLSELAGSAFEGDDTEGIPPFLLDQLLFSYQQGRTFVETLYHDAGNTWRLVNIADKIRPPVSTEQVIHPDKYLRLEQPLKVSDGDVGGILGAGWKRAESDVMGEWATGAWLRSKKAAAGWGGDRYELWTKGQPGQCGHAPPCFANDAFVLRWRWDTPKDQQEFLTAARQLLGDRARAKLSSTDVWTRPDGTAVALAVNGTQPTIAYAPTVELAKRLAAASPSA